MKHFLFIAVILLGNHSIFSQHQEVTEKPKTWQGKDKTTTDSTKILHAFKTGNFHGHLRHYFMSTDNEAGLSDYYANATGGGLRYETAPFYHFQFAVSGFYIFNTGSSNLELKDNLTGQLNRYEIGLFDVEDPTNKKDNDRLEEFYLKYNYHSSHIIFGRQMINTAFVNLQDGRMRPTGVEGVWFEIDEWKKTKLEGGWIYAVSPRGTTKWYSTGESIGIYATGFNPDGTKSGYKNNLKTKGILMAGFHTEVTPNIKLHLWNMFTENIFNTAMLQVESEIPIKNKNKFFMAGQFIRQDGINNGGNEDQAKTYFQKGGRSFTFGGRTGFKNDKLEVSLNYNRITSHGRYLMPREFGREPFFTFLPRERNEGLGDVHAFVSKVNYNINKYRLKTSLAAGYYKLPDVHNYRLNKYGMPSYAQINADIRYSFSKLLEGLEMQFLVVGKLNAGETYNNKVYVINKVNMMLYNLVLNFHF